MPPHQSFSGPEEAELHIEFVWCASAVEDPIMQQQPHILNDRPLQYPAGHPQRWPGQDNENDSCNREDRKKSGCLQSKCTTNNYTSSPAVAQSTCCKRASPKSCVRLSRPGKIGSISWCFISLKQLINLNLNLNLTDTEQNWHTMLKLRLLQVFCWRHPSCSLLSSSGCHLALGVKQIRQVTSNIRF